MEAAGNGQLEVVKFLVQTGAIKEKRDIVSVMKYELS
jgi:hypothetical protein